MSLTFRGVFVVQHTLDHAKDRAHLGVGPRRVNTIDGTESDVYISAAREAGRQKTGGIYTPSQSRSALTQKSV